MAHPHPPKTIHEFYTAASAPCPWGEGGKGERGGIAASAVAGAGCTGGGCGGMKAGSASPSTGRLRPERRGEWRQTLPARSRTATQKDPSGKGWQRLPTEPQASGSRHPERRAETSAVNRAGGAGVQCCAFWRERPSETPMPAGFREDQATRGPGGKTPVILYGGIPPTKPTLRGDFF